LRIASIFRFTLHEIRFTLFAEQHSQNGGHRTITDYGNIIEHIPYIILHITYCANNYWETANRKNANLDI